MNFEIQSNRIPINDELRNYVQQRIDYALSTRADYIDSVLVHVADCGIPGDPGDKACLVRVRLHGIPDVHVENFDENLYVAIHRAVDRAGWTVARRIARQHRQTIEHMLSDSLAATERAA